MKGGLQEKRRSVSHLRQRSLRFRATCSRFSRKLGSNLDHKSVKTQLEVHDSNLEALVQSNFYVKSSSFELVNVGQWTVNLAHMTTDDEFMSTHM